MTYDWNAELPACDWCGEAPGPGESPWLDREDFWGHPECYRVAMADPDTIRALREWAAAIR